MGVCKEGLVMEEVSKVDNKDALIAMLQDINDPEFIEFTFKFVKRLKENWGV